MMVELDPTQDEAALRDAVSRALRDASPVETLTRTPDAAEELARRHWTLAAELGWPGLLVKEEAGGAGLGLRELAVVSEEMGRHLFCGPFVATAVLGATLADLAQTQDKLPGLAEGIAGGDIVLAAALVPPSGAWLAAEESLTLADGRLRGSREVVEHVGLATHALAIDARMREDGTVVLLAALLVMGDGVEARKRQGLDPSCPIASLNLDAPVDARNLLRLEMTAAEFEALLGPVHVAIAAELTGVAQAALDGAVDYAKARHQFGAPIGSFQAIKHKLADGFVAVGNARLAVRQAASTREPSSIDAARILAAEAALKATGDYIQIQGGMGISWESEAHLHLKRARRLVAAYGDPAAIRRRIVDRFIAALKDEAPLPASAPARGTTDRMAEDVSR